MSLNPRKLRHFKRIFTAYVLLFGILGCTVFYLISLDFFKKPLFISPVGKSEKEISTVERKLKEKNISFSQILSLSNSVYLVNLPDNRQIKLSSAKDIDKQISSLQRILRELTIEGKLFKSIDFRFSEPVILF